MISCRRQIGGSDPVEKDCGHGPRYFGVTFGPCNVHSEGSTRMSLYLQPSNPPLYHHPLSFTSFSTILTRKVWNYLIPGSFPFSSWIYLEHRDFCKQTLIHPFSNYTPLKPFPSPSPRPLTVHLFAFWSFSGWTAAERPLLGLIVLLICPSIQLKHVLLFPVTG